MELSDANLVGSRHNGHPCFSSMQHQDTSLGIRLCTTHDFPVLSASISQVAGQHVNGIRTEIHANMDDPHLVLLLFIPNRSVYAKVSSLNTDWGTDYQLPNSHSIYVDNKEDFDSFESMKTASSRKNMARK